MPPLRTLPEALDRAARSGQGYTFVVGGVETRRSYAELQQASFGVARALHEAGLRRGDVVALVLADAEPFLTALFGASMAALVPASVYPPVTAGGLDRYFDLTASILRASGAKAVITTASLVAGFEALRPTCPHLALVLARESLDAPPLPPDAFPSLDDIAFVQFTSGSTSVPKGVALSHRNLSANVDAINGPAGLGTSAEDSAVSWLPLYHDMGLVGMALGPLYSERPGVLLTPQAFVKRPAEWLKAISRYRGTISFAPNFAYDLTVRRVKDRDLEGLDLSCWRVAGCGAEPIHAPTLMAFAERFAAVGFRATSFLPSYGLAEHVLAATFPPRGRLPRVEHIASDDLTKRRLAIPVAEGGASVPVVGCGLALPGHAIRVVGEDERELPDREVGEIALSGPSVMLGYYKEPALTAETLRNGWLYTGDLGYLSDGELFVCGRVKDIIIVNGRKFHPQDLEWAVAELTGVRRGRVVAFGTTQQGASDRVVIVAEPSGTVSTEALAAAIRRRVGDAFGLYVDDVVSVPSGTIGRTTSGKVQRAATKSRYERGVLVGDAADQAGLHA
jgi:fatty-acyl-CoA synthase